MAIGHELNKKCDGSHSHQQLLDGRAASAAKYPTALCKAICRGIMMEKKERAQQVRAVMKVGETFVRRKLELE